MNGWLEEKGFLYFSREKGVGYLKCLWVYYGITGEGARQLSAKEIIRFLLLFEDYFAAPFEYFNIPKSKFIRLFPEISEKGYGYISIRHRKGKEKLCEDKLTEYKVSSGLWQTVQTVCVGRKNVT